MHALGPGAAAGRGFVAWLPCLVLAAVSGTSCKLDSSVPDVSQCADCNAPDRCEEDLCVPAEASTPQDASELDGPPLDALAPLDASEDGASGECEPGEVEPCYDGPAETAEQPPCGPGRRTCNDARRWGACQEQVLPATERCNALDDDCDGDADESFDLEQDDAHCGACNRACGSGDQCCAGECVDVSSDRVHCGACGNDCTLDTACCDGECVDTGSSADHCGSSCVKCAEGQACCSGGCADLDTFQHCGACGNACDSETELCCGGSCTTSPGACGS
jgi:hypothetical protein